MNVLIIGNGSIGKQHTSSVLHLGHHPIVLTNYPTPSDKVTYISSLKDVSKTNFAIICTPTSNHLNDFKAIIELTQIKNVLIEKPITSNTTDGLKLAQLANKNNINVYVAFDMRFIEKLAYVKQHLHKIEKRIRLVKIHCGQYLPEWRPGTDYRKSYSSDILKGGGVDLDLTHEIDYMNWLFGMPKKTMFSTAIKISTLEINSPDYFKGLYEYPSFLVDLELDYFRKADRKLEIIGENEVLVKLDFISGTLQFDGQNIEIAQNTKPIIKEDHAFLTQQKGSSLCTIEESLQVLKLIKK